MALLIQFYTLLLCILTIFKVAYVKSQCNGSPLSVTVNEMTGSFKYPPSGEYSPNLQCKWLIVAPDGQKILYKLHNVGINVGTNPCTDGISVFDGDSTSAKAVETNACTTNNIYSSPIRLSSTSKVFLRFTSDGTASPGNDLGFTFLAISAADQSSCSTNGSKVYLNATTTQQYFTSPNFPNVYPKSHTCEWIISPSDQGANVTVEFKYVDVEVKGGASPGCYDKLTITYGDSLSETVEFCGNEDYSPNRVFDNDGSGGNITISFVSDFVQAERGFVVAYIQSGNKQQKNTKTTSTEASTITSTTEASTATTTTEASTTTTTTEASTTTTEVSTTTTTTEASTTTTTTKASTTPTTTKASTTTTTTEASTTTRTTEASTTTTVRNSTQSPLDEDEIVRKVIGVSAAIVVLFICVLITSLYVVKKKRNSRKKKNTTHNNEPRYVSEMVPFQDTSYDVQNIPSFQKENVTGFNIDPRTYQKGEAEGDYTYITATNTEPRGQTDDTEYTYIDGQNLNDDYLYLP